MSPAVVELVQHTDAAVCGPSRSMVGEAKRLGMDKKRQALMLRLLIASHERALAWLRAELAEAERC